MQRVSFFKYIEFVKYNFACLNRLEIDFSDTDKSYRLHSTRLQQTKAKSRHDNASHRIF